jgi:hypothetical protein
VLFDYQARNVGSKVIKDVYVGLFVDADVGYSRRDYYASDDISGFLHTAPSPMGCGSMDTLDIAWTADADGDPIDGQFTDIGGLIGKSATGVLGVRLLSPLGSGEHLSFNWWTSSSNLRYDFGPRARPTPERPFYSFRTGSLGTPMGDVNKYYQLTNGEIDYDQPLTASISPVDADWLFPGVLVAHSIAIGGDTRFLLSFGPFDLYPGQAVPFTMAFVMGENFHTDPNNIQRLKDGYIKDYYAHLDFSDLAKNAQWASWIYDNPGVDTDRSLRGSTG